jgi:hypothetical protein
MTLLGLVGLTIRRSPKLERRFARHTAGIRVVMITGDHPATRAPLRKSWA